MYQNDEVNVDTAARNIALMHVKLVKYLFTIHTDTLRTVGTQNSRKLFD